MSKELTIMSKTLLTSRRHLLSPGLHKAQIIQDFLAQFLVLNQETVAREVPQVVAWDHLLSEVSRGQLHTSSMYNGYVDSRARERRENETRHGGKETSFDLHYPLLLLRSSLIDHRVHFRIRTHDVGHLPDVRLLGTDKYQHERTEDAKLG